ncbi:hypothetical protein CPC08DRAFT_415121 [Agrocybe pediades]|nr:hypothetical protein CPC08DRAFT_415121 [Agrocybe pediades]
MLAVTPYTSDIQCHLCPYHSLLPLTASNDRLAILSPHHFRLSDHTARENAETTRRYSEESPLDFVNTTRFGKLNNSRKGVPYSASLARCKDEEEDIIECLRKCRITLHGRCQAIVVVTFPTRFSAEGMPLDLHLLNMEFDSVKEFSSYSLRQTNFIMCYDGHASPRLGGILRRPEV